MALLGAGASGEVGADVRNDKGIEQNHGWLLARAASTIDDNLLAASRVVVRESERPSSPMTKGRSASATCACARGERIASNVSVGELIAVAVASGRLLGH